MIPRADGPTEEKMGRPPAPKLLENYRGGDRHEKFHIQKHGLWRWSQEQDRFERTEAEEDFERAAEMAGLPVGEVYRLCGFPNYLATRLPGRFIAARWQW